MLTIAAVISVIAAILLVWSEMDKSRQMTFTLNQIRVEAKKYGIRARTRPSDEYFEGCPEELRQIPLWFLVDLLRTDIVPRKDVFIDIISENNETAYTFSGDGQTKLQHLLAKHWQGIRTVMNLPKE